MCTYFFVACEIYLVLCPCCVLLILFVCLFYGPGAMLGIAKTPRRGAIMSINIKYSSLTEIKRI